MLTRTLLSVLSPLGQHRKTFVTPSKGKKSRKRKHGEELQPERAIPEVPEISKSIDVGLRNITRKLEGAASDQLAVIFVARSEQPSAFHSHFPQMVGVASKSHPLSEPIRLVGFSKSSEDKLSACLGIPRVSCLAVANHPKSKILVELVRKLVPPVEISWLGETQDGQFRETKINSVLTAVGQARPRQKEPKKK